MNTNPKNISQSEPARGNEQVHLDQLFDNAQVGIVMADNDGTVIRVNPEFSKIFGYSAQECEGQNIDQLVAHDNDRKTASQITRAIANGEKKAFEAQRCRKDGTRIQVLVMASPIFKDDKQVAVYAFYRDITRQRRVEEALIKARKLEAVGTLAGGIAHDFNNLLSIIIGNIDLAMLDTPENLTSSKALERAKEACLKAHALTFKFLTFSSGGNPIKRTIDLRDLLKDAVEQVFAGTQIRTRIECNAQLINQVDPNQFKYVFEGICENALESIKEEGEVVITAGMLDEALQTTNPILDNDKQYQHIVIADNGIGIPAASLEKIFDPYFSTKPTVFKKGMGMGLTVAHSIITNHGGHIEVDSEYRKGTQVHIYLPVS